MATSLLYYNPAIITMKPNEQLPGAKKFFSYFSLYGFVAPVDRTSTLKLPIRTTSLYPIPEFRNFHKTFEDICNDRAVSLLADAAERNLEIYVLWSGGIDSTLLLISLLKAVSPQQKEKIIVLLSEDSIAEYPDFYRSHIRGKLRVGPSDTFSQLLGEEALFIGGEHNDQLFGSDMIGALIQKFGPQAIHERYNRETFFSLFNGKIRDPAMTNFYLDLFERLKAAAPVAIELNHQFLWWINFSLKWQDVSLRMLMHTADRNAQNIRLSYIGTNYVHFYNTEEFQLWSLNNLDKKIKDVWKTYKWPCKDIIFDYTKDALYRDNKTKRASLCNLIEQTPAFNFIVEDGTLVQRLSVDEYYVKDNDFI